LSTHVLTKSSSGVGGKEGGEAEKEDDKGSISVKFRNCLSGDDPEVIFEN